MHYHTALSVTTMNGTGSITYQYGKTGKTTGTYEGGSKSFRPDTQKSRQMENAVRDI